MDIRFQPQADVPRLFLPDAVEVLGLPGLVLSAISYVCDIDVCAGLGRQKQRATRADCLIVLMGGQNENRLERLHWERHRFDFASEAFGLKHANREIDVGYSLPRPNREAIGPPL